MEKRVYKGYNSSASSLHSQLRRRRLQALHGPFSGQDFHRHVVVGHCRAYEHGRLLVRRHSDMPWRRWTGWPVQVRWPQRRVRRLARFREIATWLGTWKFYHKGLIIIFNTLRLFF